ncbi:PTS sugar transporter subunit IIA [Olsenella sp. Marseille-P4559]|uniref:PTS sugar transporter subunit IIA n=1 Tax=Olsenella sp. Marseille-P4559 TaxID=2364795 RepID=UPI00103041D8|nr:PTS sugar transporter subunit IIA [Olsenella sp. Marseille-P4559]
MLLRKELVNVNLEASSKEDLLHKLANEFLDEDLVKPSFMQAILDREEEYPTGLPAVAFDIAIPHCAASNINETSMGVATLAHPIEFQQMGSPEITLHPEVVFMLAIQDPGKQLETLQKIMAVIQDCGLLESIRAAKSADELYGLLAPRVN